MRILTLLTLLSILLVSACGALDLTTTMNEATFAVF